MIQPNYFALSFVGKRSSNEDAFLTVKLNETSYFIAVADGMGGATSGQVASQTVLKAAKRFLELIFAVDPNPTNLKNILKQTYQQCQKEISEAIEKNPDFSGMGTTLACVLISGSRFVTGNVGDSRVYKYSNNNMQQISEDHTFIQDYQNKEGRIADANMQAQYGHMLTRCIDGGQDLPDIFPLEDEYDLLLPRMGFIICSDGLILNKSDNETSWLKNYFLGTKTLKSSAETLISHAYKAGSTDNITVALVEYGTIPRNLKEFNKIKFPPDEERPPTQIHTPKSSLIKILITLTIISILAITALAIKKSGLSLPENIFNFNSESDSTRIPLNQQKEKKNNISPNQQLIEPPVISGNRASYPTGQDAPLTWEVQKLNNDSLKYNIFFYDLKKNLIQKKEDQKSPIYLRDFSNLESGKAYFWKVQAVTKSGLTTESKLKKIIVQ